MLRNGVNRGSLPFSVYYSCRFFHLGSRKLVRRKISDSVNAFKKNPEHLLTSDENPNLNFLGVEGDIGIITLKPHSENSTNNLKSFASQTLKSKSKEQYFLASFGIVRKDSDNNLKYHGQYDKHIEMTFPHKSTDFSNVSDVRKKDDSMTFVDECFFGDIKEKESQATTLTDKEFNAYEKNDQNTYFGENVKSEELNFIDENYFGDAGQIYNEKCSRNVVSNELNYIDENCSENIAVRQKLDTKDVIKNDIQARKDLNFVDENYFKTTTALNAVSFDNLSSEDSIGNHVNTCYNNDKNTTYVDITNVNIIEKQCNSVQSYESMPICSQRSLSNLNKTITHNKIMSKVKVTNSEFTHTGLMSNLNKASNETSKLSNTLPNKHQIPEPEKNNKIVTDTSSLHSLQNKKSDTLNRKYDSSSHERKFQSVKTNVSCDKQLNNSQQSTAHNFIKLHQEISYELKNTGIKVLKKEKLDSKGFRILTNQVLDLSHCTLHEIINILKNSIVYSDDDILILNKPYSLIIHDSQTTKQLCLSSFLDEFAKEMDPQSREPKLFTVHRIDKETTGCLLLARNQSMADNLKSLFAQRKIIKKYWIVTARVPEELEGIIDIPIAEGSIDGKRRMVLHPDLPQDINYQNHSRSGKRAITTYKVLSQYGNAALIEVTPETGIKHQIRVHFGFGLSCPILGDHKYSHLDKLVPQKLPSDILQKLQVRQSKVRHIPMHIHARSVTVPSYTDGRSLFVMAPIPHHMTINVKRLKIKKS